MDSPKDNSSTATFKIHKKIYKSYSVGSLSNLSNATLDILINMFECESNKKPARLEGRVAPQFASIPEAGPVVIKFYKRGGWISRINKEKYLKISKTRSRKEFEFFISAGKAGVNVPMPVAYASRGFPFYKAWLITKEIADHTSFAQLCFNEREKALSLIPEISRNIRLLIKNGIHHVDLHPGNIVIDKNNKIYIIDFDRAHYCSQNRSCLTKKYQRRWTKAIHKYRLPDAYTDLRLTEE